MKLAVLFAAVVVGNAAAVTASPDDNEPTERLSYTGKSDVPARDDGWVEIASPTPASHGREFITVDAESGAFVRLRLTATTGRPTVERVRIYFVDGTQRSFAVNKTLNQKRSHVVNLPTPKRIERVVVDTRGPRKAMYAVHGEHVRAGVARR